MNSIVAFDPLKRINLAQPTRKLINNVLKEYGLGKLESYEILQKGIIEINIKVITTKGEYIIKIFSNKRLQRVKDILTAQQVFYNKGIPFSKIYTSTAGESYFTTYSKKRKPFYGCIIQWFDGHDFTDTNPTPSTLKKIAKYIAMINKTKLEIKPIYDDCFPINLSKEYKKRKKAVEPEVRPLIESIIQEFNKVDLNKLRWETIHGDLSWEHFLMDKKGNLCILDLGGLNINPIILDLAYAMSFYCVNPKNPFKSRFKRNYSIILNEYLKHINLSKYELNFLPLFIKASLAQDYITGRYYKEIFRDKIWFTPEKFIHLLDLVTTLRSHTK